jgi:hypothetical protein
VEDGPRLLHECWMLDSVEDCLDYCVGGEKFPMG